MIMRRNRLTVTKSRANTSHTFHLLMTLFTGGLWAVVWAAKSVLNRRRRVTQVTYGQGPDKLPS